MNEKRTHTPYVNVSEKSPQLAVLVTLLWGETFDFSVARVGWGKF